MTIWGNFIIHNNPSISNAIANGAASNSSNASNPASQWPQYSSASPYLINLNQTGGTPTQFSAGAALPNVTIHVGPGLSNDISIGNAFTWEGGRGIRCDFWKSVGVIVPE